MASKSVIDELKKTQILELLEQGKRVDGRALDEPREISIEVNAIPKANGSARIFLGDTEVVCGVKIQPDRPFPDMGDKGIFICTAELLPLSHPTVETGPPQPHVIELARVTDRGIRESHMVDVSQLVIEKDKSVVGVFADIVVVDYDGNLFGSASSDKRHGLRVRAASSALDPDSPLGEPQDRTNPTLDASTGAEYGLRKSRLPQSRRVLGGTARDRDDSRVDLHSRLRILQYRDRPSGGGRPRRTRPSGQGRRGAGTAACRHHFRRSR